MKLNKLAIKYDEKICKGCLCKMLSQDSSTPLNEFCIGNPSIMPADYEKYILCPCSECLVKSMCSMECKKYDLFRRLNKGSITTITYRRKLKGLEDGTDRSKIS